MNELPSSKSLRIWILVVLVIPFIAFLFFFRGDILPGSRGWWDLILILFNRKEPPLDSSLYPSMLRIAVNVFTYVFIFLVSTFVVAQFVLPVRAWKDRWSAFIRLLMYATKWTRGPAIFVHNGKLVTRIGEEDNTNPGVIVADMRSAVVVEQEYPFQGEAEDTREQPSLEKEIASERYGGVLRTLRFFTPPEKDYTMARALRPGIQFTRLGEKVRTVLDLRRQVRVALGDPITTPEGKKIPQPGVKAFTRDGIEVGANCYVVFSLSDPPDVIPVGYWGGTDSGNLHELEIRLNEDGSLVTIIDVHPLDSDDAEEIHRAVSSYLITPVEFITEEKKVDPTGLNQYRFPFNEERIFAASYGQAYGTAPNDKSQWHELPLLIASDIFRNLMEKYNFDYLYSVDSPNLLPWMDELKTSLNRQVKYQGILSYHLVRPANLPRLDAIHWKWQLDDERWKISKRKPISRMRLEYSNTRALLGPKSLRDRGIKVVASGFSELKIPLEIRERMAERWKARWEREIQIVSSRQDREAMQIISSARNRAQRDNAYFLANLFNGGKHSAEALALMVFQSLELAATDLKNQKDLPPKEVLAMLQNLHNWLLRERLEIESKKKQAKNKDHLDDENSPLSPV